MSLLVLVPYVPGMLHPRVLPAIEAQGYHPVPIAIDPTDDLAYPRLIQRVSATARRDLLIIEHDIESRHGLIDEFVACPEPWCWNSYRVQDGGGLPEHYTMLGHTRFRAEILGLVAQAGIGTWLGHDQRISAYLLDHGVPSHRHAASVIHHHAYPSRY